MPICNQCQQYFSKGKCPVCFSTTETSSKQENTKKVSAQNEKCPICYRKITEDLFHSPNCKRPFHEYHFVEYVKAAGYCPSCRGKIQL